MLTVPEVSDIDAAFPVNPPLPEWDDIPEEFKQWHNDFAKIAAMLFYNGGKLSDHGLTPKGDLDEIKAIRAIRACLGSFEPKHEHKMAGVAYMLSEWFDKN